MVVPQSVVVLGITFHSYGLILGIAGLVVIRVLFYVALRHKIPSELLTKYVITAVIGGVIGARLWHVVTDWHLYSADLSAIFAVWRGGLSILGALMGLSVAIGVQQLLLKHYKKTVLAGKMLVDLLAVSLPLGQAIGRLANYVNQELFGLPTSLPWGITIAPARRPAEFVEFDRFHPLFAYEAVGMLLFLVILWKLCVLFPRFWSISTGRLGTLYLLYYAMLRIILDFLRPDVQRFGTLSVTLNQIFLTGFLLIVFLYLFVRSIRMDKHEN